MQFVMPSRDGQMIYRQILYSEYPKIRSDPNISWIIVHHPQSITDGFCLILKLWRDQIYSFGYDVVVIFWHLGLKLPVHAHFLGDLGRISPSGVTHHPNPEKDSVCAEARRLSRGAW